MSDLIPEVELMMWQVHPTELSIETIGRLVAEVRRRRMSYVEAFAEGERAGKEAERERLQALLDCDTGPCCVVNGRLYVNCSDTFSYATADGVEVLPEELDAVYRAHLADPKHGALRWATQKDGRTPIAEVAAALAQADGAEVS